MTKEEQKTLYEIKDQVNLSSQQLANHIVESKEIHKKNSVFIEKAQPIIKAWENQKITDKYVDGLRSATVSLLKFIALVVGIAATIIAIVTRN